MPVSLVCRLAVADFKERARRASFLIALLAVLGLAYCALPPPGSSWMIFRMGDYRGVYDSASIGAVVATVGGFWLALGGFYFVKSAVSRDQSTGVGQVLAATSMSRTVYVAGKWLSNLLVLLSMAAVLAAGATVMQLVRGESDSLDPIALLLPFAIITLPLLGLTASLAVLFEMIRPLRAGIGNIVWFFGWILAATPVSNRTGPLDLLGVGAVVSSMREEIHHQYPSPGDTESSMGLNISDPPSHTFEWSGLDVTADLVASRLVAVALTAAVVALAASLFNRFEPSRAWRSRADERLGSQEAPVEIASALGPASTRLLPPATRGRSMASLWVGELRILIQGMTLWWWLVAAALVVGGFVVPMSLVPALILPLTWIWPVLVWSRMGTQASENGVTGLLDSCAARRLRLLAEYLAGVALAAVLGIAPFARMVVDGDWPGALAWSGGVLFIPALALATGVTSRSSRLFQGLYLALWYFVVNGGEPVDFMGAIRTDGNLEGPGGPVVLLCAGLLCAAAFAVREVRHARR